MSDTPACIVDCKNILGEGPVWVEREEALYWVDIKGLRVFRRSIDGDVTSWETPLRIGSLAPRSSGGFIAGTERGFAAVDLDQGTFEVLFHPEPHLPTNRFNDGKVDPRGLFWAGTMDDEEKVAQGALHRLHPDLSSVNVDEGYHVTNGPAFSPDGTVMYHNDSARQVTYAFDLDEAGNASNRRVFARYGDGDGYPDGMTVDSEGCLWIAFWDGWCLRRYSPRGECLTKIDVPVARPTSCAFGGRDLDLLFITSARIGLDDVELGRQPQAGGLFLHYPGIIGVAAIAFAG